MSKIVLLLSLGVATNLAFAEATCPSAALEAAKRRVPGANVGRCREDGAHFEVKLQKKDRSNVEVKVTATGEVLALEETIPASALPVAVVKAFAAHYPKSRVEKVERSTTPKATLYEVSFSVDSANQEATFDENGTFVEED